MTLAKEPRPNLTHLAWCALIAVRLARQEGKASSPLKEHLFIMQWLTTAQKRHLFPKDVAPDIAWLLNEGKRYGFGASLCSKIDYIHRSGSRELACQSVLFRLTFFVDTLKTMGWLNFLLSPEDWASGWRNSRTACAVYTAKERLNPSFDENGALNTPLELRFTGDASGLPALAIQCHVNLQQQGEKDGFSVFILHPDV